MEEMLEEVARARQIFERWMQWEPEEEAWMAYVKFEKRYKELERARVIYERFVHIHPEPKNWIKWAEFEEREGKNEKAREIYTRAIEVMGEELMDQRLFIAFAKFETRLKEVGQSTCNSFPYFMNSTCSSGNAKPHLFLNRLIGQG
jgi:crooked neck